MELCKEFVCTETLQTVANETRFSILGGGGGGGGGGGQLPVTCERCNICTVTGEGTSFWQAFI